MTEEPTHPYSLYAQERKQRLIYILTELSTKNKPIELNQFIGTLALNWGLRTKKVEEYFQQLKTAELIKINSEWELGQENRTAQITKAGREFLEKEKAKP